MTYKEVLAKLLAGRGVVASPYTPIPDSCETTPYNEPYAAVNIKLSELRWCTICMFLDHANQPYFFNWPDEGDITVLGAEKPVEAEKTSDWQINIWSLDYPPWEISNWIKQERACQASIT